MASTAVDLGALEAKINYATMRDVLGGSISMTILATIFVALHVGIKKYQRRALTVDSWLFIACLVCYLHSFVSGRCVIHPPSLANAGQSRSYMVL
jgi:hypothetical protein